MCRVAAAILALLATASESQTPCVDPATGVSLEPILTALDGQGLGLETPYGRMVLNPCRAMTTQPNVACPANALCCINVNSTGWTSCGSSPRFLRYGEYLDPRAAMAQEIVGGGVCTTIPPKNLQTTIAFECDQNPAAPPEGFVKPSAVPPGFVHAPCVLNVTWQTRLVCDQPLPPPAPPPRGEEDGMGWGWGFNIFLLVSVGLYCGGGAFYNHRKYMLPFPDNLPQRELWRELPIMVMEGVDFTRSKLPAQLGGKDGDSYNPVTKEEEGKFDEF